MLQKFVFIFILSISLFSVNLSRAQGSVCADTEPFCAGDERLTFPNSHAGNSNQVSAEVGPYYGCLLQTPYPAWFFLQVEEAGDLIFTLTQATNEDLSGALLDVDFAVWGPFERGTDYCSSGALNRQNLIDCSYSSSALETMTIPDAMPDEVYVVLITNFQQEAGYIGLQQVNTGGGSTDCSIIDGVLGEDVIVCGADQYILDGTSEGVEVYEWYRYNEVTGQYDLIAGEDGSTLTVTQSGDYRLVVKDLVGVNEEKDDVTVSFFDKTLIGETEDLFGCAENISTIDLTQTAPDLLEPYSNSSDYEVLYFEDETSAQVNEPILNPVNFNFEEGITIFARVRSRESGCLSEIESFNLAGFDFPVPDLPEKSVFCIDLNGNLIDEVTLGGYNLGDDYIFEWSNANGLLGTDPSITFDEFPGPSSLQLKITNVENRCSVELITMPVTVSRPSAVDVDISGTDFGDGYVVLAIPENENPNEEAVFEYQLDNLPWQAGNIFKDVPPGSHIVKVREINGCGVTSSEEFFLVGYPRYFTPNSDGYNDSWNIISNTDLTILRLHIFDRYGKLLKQLDPRDTKGWDGTYNGKDLPSNDYWFRIEFIDQTTGERKIYSSNFSLIR